MYFDRFDLSENKIALSSHMAGIYIYNIFDSELTKIKAIGDGSENKATYALYRLEKSTGRISRKNTIPLRHNILAREMSEGGFQYQAFHAPIPTRSSEFLIE